MADSLSLYDFPPHPFELFKRRDFSGEVKGCVLPDPDSYQVFLLNFGLSRRHNQVGPPLELKQNYLGISVVC
jgi:hypothetical protein